ncbi:hypothetical protein K466DRAFT_460814, partial [Polyporus arcularius HHB13444]
MPGVKAFAEKARIALEQAHDVILAARVNTTYQANKRRAKDAPHYEVGDLVYLSTKKLSLPKGRARKLAPKYVGPFKAV